MLKMELEGFFILGLFTCFLIPKISSEKFQIIIPEKSARQESNTTQNKTIDTLVQQQTDLIKKIVSSHKMAAVEYPIVTKKEAEVKESKVKEEKERESIEELRRRCQQLSATKNISNTEFRSETKENSNRVVTTVEAFGPNKKPQFLQKINEHVRATLPSNFSHPTQVEQMSNRYFVITRNRTGTSNNKTLAVNKEESFINRQDQAVVSSNLQNVITPTEDITRSNIKYVQLEPVILQKMTLNNGRMLFYWYKRIPVIPQFVSAPKEQIPTFRYPSQNVYPAMYPLQAPNSYNQNYPSQSISLLNSQTLNAQSQTDLNTRSENSNIQSDISETVNIPSQTTDSNPPLQVVNIPTRTAQFSDKYVSQNSYNPQISNYASSHYTQGQNYQTATRTNPPDSISVFYPPPQPLSTTPNPVEKVPNYEIEYTANNDKSDDNLYKKQMKFVIPMPYPVGENLRTPTGYPWQFDPYAYYPKPLQPSVVNVPVPYLPTFHMIKTIRMPENLINANNVKTDV